MTTNNRSTDSVNHSGSNCHEQKSTSIREVQIASAQTETLWLVNQILRKLQSSSVRLPFSGVESTFGLLTVSEDAMKTMWNQIFYYILTIICEQPRLHEVVESSAL